MIYSLFQFRFFISSHFMDNKDKIEETSSLPVRQPRTRAKKTILLFLFNFIRERRYSNLKSGP
jgi:hypothetical protein